MADSHTPTGPQPAPAPGGRPDGTPHVAGGHYFRGNRFYEQKLWDRAVAEWRRAFNLWHPAGEAAGSSARRFANLRAVLALVFTVILVHQLLFVFFPRPPLDMLMMGTQAGQNRTWWEQFLDTGRPREGSPGRMTMREWWSLLKERLQGSGGEREFYGRNGARPRISQRWAELLRRYGRWGPMSTWDLDFSVISGNGLSRLGEYESAVAILEERVKWATGREKLADLYQGIANAHYYKGYGLQPDGTAKYDLPFVRLAAEAYERSLRSQPRPLSYGNLGWMYFLLEDYERAEKYSLRALQINEHLAYVRLNLGLVYLVQDKKQKAFETYYGALSRNPNPDVYLGGITDLKEVVRDNPGRHPFGYLIIGLLSIKQGDPGEARDALTRFLSGPPQGNQWTNIARNLLNEMDTAAAER